MWSFYKKILRVKTKCNTAYYFKTANGPLPFILQVFIVELEVSRVHGDVTPHLSWDFMSSSPLQLSGSTWLNSHPLNVNRISCITYVVPPSKKIACLLLPLPLPKSCTENMKQLSQLVPIMQMKWQPRKWLDKKTEETGSPGPLVQGAECPTFPGPQSSLLTSVSFVVADSYYLNKFREDSRN